MKTYAFLTLTIIAIVGVPMTGSAQQPDPYDRTDDSWITIGGTVEDVSRNSFLLDYGEGVITVEMDDWDDDADAYVLLEGDEVTVSGRIDDDLYDLRTIEAARVYVDNANTYFYSNPRDEQDEYVGVPTPLSEGEIFIEGTVTDVTPRQNEFEIVTDGMFLNVDTSLLGYDPLDRDGTQEVTVGDRVSVNGTIDSNFFDNHEIVAESVVELSMDYR